MEAQKELRKLANKKYAADCQRFFKMGKGEYAEGDKFLGVRAPDTRKIAKRHTDIPINHIKKLITSKFHEERLLGLVIVVNKYEKTKDDSEREKLYKFYLKHFKYINNWDLVDVTCPHIIGRHLLDRDRSILYTWANSKDLWTKRIAMLTNWWFIRKGDTKDVFPIAKILLKDEHDLIHKAVGWMLREAAKKDMLKAEVFLKKHYKEMPRTMLRYAIERFPETKRKKYLAGNI